MLVVEHMSAPCDSFTSVRHYTSHCIHLSSCAVQVMGWGLLAAIYAQTSCICVAATVHCCSGQSAAVAEVQL